ncbi:MAG: zinc ABC transporter substrate-binding protein [Candidatus Devosia phytovorans]|uniref:High-affinity zinc uptake system protein ZnuA n=1 Tax=Candidatus Devosia phytovorans TaxID=3121372 RepID=A0AAJ5VRZ3_9HYPH|nr:zinc ABC transporter substrate-binding protein [Devosia sp.]WEK03132.1 MAG: zinc ABC transporter substrate-binding protein [Devosia sp.]
MKLLAPISLLSMALLTSTAMAAPNVVASIKPVHSLVAAVMAGVGEPTLIVKGSASPHTYALRPSDAGALESADLVFWTGHGMELFLGDALDTLAGKAMVVELADAPGITLLPVREGGAFEAHSHGDEDHDHDHEGHDHAHEEGEGDMHFWLDPENAKLMVTQIATTLSEADPDNAAAYQANAEAESTRLDALETELTATLAPVADRPFVVFHDAYQYFEARFGLTLAGSVTVTPDVTPGAARIDELKAKVSTLGATCVFAEPNFEPTIIKAITEGTEAKSGVLDPEGGALEEGVELYPTLLRGLASSLVDCLG